MSGHSKWSTIKRQKGVTDHRRGQAFTKAANAISIAAREGGGGNPETNFRLRLAIEAAKNINMPKENIERAIARGVGGGKEGLAIEQITYEGFAPGGVAVLIEAVTDNRSRTAQEIRSTFDRSGGTLGGPGSVSHLFRQAGEIVIHFEEKPDQDEFLTVAAEVGAQDVDIFDKEAVIYCDPTDIEKVKDGLVKRGLKIVESKLSRIPISVVKIADEKMADRILSLMNKLEDLRDVQKVYSNFDIPDEILQKEVRG